jgi:hypothetical protein
LVGVLVGGWMRLLVGECWWWLVGGGWLMVGGLRLLGGRVAAKLKVTKHGRVTVFGDGGNGVWGRYLVTLHC